MKVYYVLVKPTFVSVWPEHFFESEGGIRAPWGIAWKRVEANNFDEAHAIATHMSVEMAAAEAQSA